jgi:antitoxin component YwqK of YwqJK toxin-antitoxin module
MEVRDQSQLPQVVRNYFGNPAWDEEYDDIYCEEYFVINGKREGEYKVFYDGNLETVCYYINDKLHGECNGESKYYYENGNLMNICNYVNGNRHGCYKQYDEKGNLINTEYYINDVLQE